MLNLAVAVLLCCHIVYAAHNTALALQGVPIGPSVALQWGAVIGLGLIVAWVINRYERREARNEERIDDNARRTQEMIRGLQDLLRLKEEENKKRAELDAARAIEARRMADAMKAIAEKSGESGK